MKSDHIAEMLDDYARQSLPPAPVEINAGVWMEIERRRQQSFWSRIPLLEWRELFAEPRLAVPAFALALLVGVLPALTFAHSSTRPESARLSLHLDVFSARAPSLPATLISSDPATRVSR